MDNKNASGKFAKVSFKTLKYVIFAVIILVCATVSYRFGSQIFDDKGVDNPPGMDMVYTVKEGMSLSELADELKEFGIINSANVFVVQSYIYDVREVKAGTYNLNTSFSNEKIFRILSEGPMDNREITTGEQQ